MGAKQRALARVRPVVDTRSDVGIDGDKYSGSSTSYSLSASKEEFIKCSVCWELTSDRNILVCNNNHTICGEDVRRLFEIWIKDRTTTRPQCFDTQFNIRNCVRFLRREILQEYHARLRELAESAGKDDSSVFDGDDDRFVRESLEKHDM
ncbi:hypothetical protein PMZ80_009419 [Knufia obscura]|uniref:Uncharacterized protein n=1 Tax=Knufia obscura TaxID=1635080 RepID=A0ABR0RE23_9EURO|nr:hypothetical protein PMZ80_009419 [Knufia obscura]